VIKIVVGKTSSAKKRFKYLRISDFLSYGHEDNTQYNHRCKGRYNNKGYHSNDASLTLDIFVSPRCSRCHSANVIRKERRQSKRKDDMPRWKCKDCGYRFTDSPTFKTQFPLWVIGRVLDLASEGARLKKIKEEIIRDSKQKLTLTTGTLRNIIQKYVKLLLLFEFHVEKDKFTCDTWLIDDTPQMPPKKNNGKDNGMVRRKRKINPESWIINIMEQNKRYWHVGKVTPDRDADAYEEAVRLALKGVKYAPWRILCDKLRAQISGIRRVLRHVIIDSRSKKEDFGHINLIERLHSTMRRKGIKKWGGFRPQTWLQCRVDLIRIRYNFLDRHSALNGLTPAMKAGIVYPPCSGFEDLIRYAYLFLTRKKGIWPFT